MSDDPYRHVDAADEFQATLGLASFKATCPACGAVSYRHCSYCGSKPDPKYTVLCGSYPCKGSLVDSRGLRTKACSPGRRLKLGWFRRCKVSGEHVHQECQTCGWQGISSPWKKSDNSDSPK